MPKRTMIFYGNCQAEFMRDLLRVDPAAGDLFHYVYVCSYSTEREPLPTDEDFANCVLLCEQIDWKEFPHRDRLPADCPTILFPSLDSLLLWPFNCINPYNVSDLPTFPNGRFICGDRIILREVDKNRSPEDIHDYYLNGWEDYKVNVKRVRELERIRIEKRDARCDVPAGDLVIGKLGREPLFWNIGHPRRPLLAALMARVLERCSTIEPALYRVDPQRLESANPQVGKGLSEVAVPIHPAIANELELEWYRNDTIYQQYGGLAFSYSDYFDQLIRYSIANKRKLASGEATTPASAWQLPITGPTTAADASGNFPDGFMGKELVFRLTAQKPLSGITVQGFCPSHHTQALDICGLIDGTIVSTSTAQPGTLVRLTLAVELESGQSAKVALRSSAVMNLLARGETEDSRDFSVLILSIEAHEHPTADIARQ